MEALLERVIDGDTAAWQKLWQAAEPTVWAVTGKFQVTGPLSEREDDRRNIVLEVMDQLQADDFRRLRAYLTSAERRASSFRSWLATVSVRAAIDYVRRHSEYRDVRGRHSLGGDRWVRHMPLGEPAATRPAVDPVNLTTATLMLERAREVLRRDQLLALCRWLQGDDFEAIAARLGLSRPAAQKLLRSALKRLRDRYRPEPATTTRRPA